MRSRYQVRETERAHFVTSTIVAWLPVFHSAACCDILAHSLDYCRREKGLRLYVWVIVPDHLHAVLHANNLSRIMADVKTFTAGKLLEAERREWLLDLLAAGKAAHKTRSSHRVFLARPPTSSCPFRRLAGRLPPADDLLR